MTLVDRRNDGSAEAIRHSASDGESPPLVPFTLCVGITGHRHEALPPGYLAKLPGLIRETLTMLIRGAEAVRASADDCFAAGGTRLVFVSALADGTDQIAAEAALELGFSLQSALPFAREEYRRDFNRAEAATRFDALVGKAEHVNMTPISAALCATASSRRSRFHSHPMPASAVTPNDRYASHAD
ncbi:MAG: hypothetical protein ABIN68_01020, partial [Sphingomicrobium sp.]